MLEWVTAEKDVMRSFPQDYSKGESLGNALGGRPRLEYKCRNTQVILRLEAGILSYLGDMDRTNNPYEVGLDWMIDLDQEDDFIGKEALVKLILRAQKKN
ncbi:MAG: hypothetical protein Ct9H300mP6_08530 [Gammaproteobacteria bacterium]|nr:MAG: hypothetical protein Ct9H300mP6_08530 [Gammaproteobacteria bacterium]